jgi:DNA-binding CsgD family transcriptional regulator
VATTTLGRAASRAEAGDWNGAKALYLEVLAESGAAEAHEGLATACWWLGEVATAIEHAQQGFDAHERRGNDAGAAMLAVRLCVWYLTNLDNVAAAHGWLARARHAAGRCDDPAVLGWTELVSAYLADDPARSLQELESAAAVAEAARDTDLATMAMADLGLLYVSRGDVERGLRLLDEAMAATFALPRRMLDVVVWSSCDMLAACTLLDDVGRAADWCRAADRFMETYGCPFLHARCRAHYGRVLVAAGRWQEAEAELYRALHLSPGAGRGPYHEALTGLAELRLRQGEPEVALRLIDGADATPWAAIIGADCLVAVGRADDARSRLHGALGALSPDEPAVTAVTAALVEADLEVGSLDEASALVQIDAPVWQVQAFPRGAGRLERAAGLVAAESRDPELARVRLVRALEVFNRAVLPFEAARTELDLARLLALDDPYAARARAGSVLSHAVRLGARGLANEAAALLRALGVTPPAGPLTAAPLSGRERDVLLLVAEGLTNRQIAERLFVSPRTVGNHVSSILRKLGLRSRSEAAAFAARTGALGTAMDRVPAR